MKAMPSFYVFLLLPALFCGCEEGGAGPATPSGLAGPGSVLPEIQAEGWLNSGPVTRSSLEGRVAVIDVWAFWCGPCAAVTPELVATHAKYAPRGVVFVGLTSDGGAKLENIRAFVERFNIPWATAYGAGPTIAALGVHSIPVAFVVGRNGQITWNSRLGGSLDAAIEAELAR